MEDFIEFNREVLQEPSAEVEDLDAMKSTLTRLFLPYVNWKHARECFGVMLVQGMTDEYSKFMLTAYKEPCGKKVLYGIHVMTCKNPRCESACVHEFLEYKKSK